MGELKICVEGKKRQSLSTEIQSSLKQEILHLQKQLEDLFVVRATLEKALTDSPLSPLCHQPTNENSITKPAEDLIKDIAVLELEVVYLEKRLLSLYRKKFDDRISIRSTSDEDSTPKSATYKWLFSKLPGHDVTIRKKTSKMYSSRSLLLPDLTDNTLKVSADIAGATTLEDSSIHRSDSSLSQNSAGSFRKIPHMGTLAEAINSYHSLPLSMLERSHDATSNATSLAEHLGARIPDHIPETPNWLSEEMIKCISAIYSELAEPPLINHGFLPSPTSSSSSIIDSSPQRHYDKCSPEFRKNSSFQLMDNPFNIERPEEFSGSYSTTIEVRWICRDSQRLKGVNHMLQNFRSLVSRLEEVDPKKMKHEEKLAFWINVHNALVMHAFLVNGIPYNNLRRMSLLLKAAYNVGGHSVSVDMIQNSILGCRLLRPGQWLQILLFPKSKFKARDERKVYAIEHQEPRLKFAVCSGSHSDPVVRVYTAKNVFQELEAAKEDYIEATIRVHKEQKVLLPKIVDSFAKEMGLCPVGFVETIQHFLPNSLRMSFQQHGKSWKRIEWIPHNFTFRYLLSKELISQVTTHSPRQLPSRCMR